VTAKLIAIAMFDPGAMLQLGNAIHGQCWAWLACAAVAIGWRGTP
jgi:hypothetical protein